MYFKIHSPLALDVQYCHREDKWGNNTTETRAFPSDFELSALERFEGDSDGRALLGCWWNGAFRFDFYRPGIFPISGGILTVGDFINARNNKLTKILLNGSFTN